MEKILVIGSVNVDLIGVGNQKLIPHDSNIGRVDLMVGGVGKNIAENLKLLRCDVSFLTFLGQDAFSKIITDHLDRVGLDYQRSLWMDYPSGKYLAVHQSDGSLEVGVNDLSLIDKVELKDLEARFEYIDQFDTLVFDTNLSQPIIDLMFQRFASKKIIVDGVCRAKVVKLKDHLNQISLLKVNRNELEALVGHPIDDVILTLRDLALKGMRQIVVTNGAEPITYNIERRVYQTAIFDAKVIRSSVGCGDAMLAAMIYGLSEGHTMHEAVNLGKKAAALTMEVYAPVNPLMSPELIKD
jgi:pseudouridine kinase